MDLAGVFGDCCRNRKKGLERNSRADPRRDRRRKCVSDTIRIFIRTKLLRAEEIVCLLRFGWLNFCTMRERERIYLFELSYSYRFSVNLGRDRDWNKYVMKLNSLYCLRSRLLKRCCFVWRTIRKTETRRFALMGGFERNSKNVSLTISRFD